MKKRGWEKRFAESINKEMRNYKKNKKGFLSESEKWIVVGIKDCIYLLGASMGKEYNFANGFQKFLNEIGITELTN